MTDLVPVSAVDVSIDRSVAVGFLAAYRQPTRGNYEIALRKWFEWCVAHDLRPLNARRSHIEIWSRELEEIGRLKPATVAGRLNVLAGFYRYAKSERVIADNPMDFVRRPKVPTESSRSGLTRGELHACMEAAKRIGDQAHALICILGLLGPRIGEVCALDVEDLGAQGSFRTLKIRREKGNRSGEVPVSWRLSQALDFHLGTRSTGPLFLKRNGERLDRKAAARIVDRVVAKAGITGKRITPHSFRHTLITLAHDANCSPRDIQNSMGYADLRQLSRYDRNKDSLNRHVTHAVSAYVEGS